MDVIHPDLMAVDVNVDYSEVTALDHTIGRQIAYKNPINDFKKKAMASVHEEKRGKLNDWFLYHQRDRPLYQCFCVDGNGSTMS